MEKPMKSRCASSIAHYSSRVTRHRFCYRSPIEYLISNKLVPKTLAENGVRSGSALAGTSHFVILNEYYNPDWHYSYNFVLRSKG